jgi:hypothetical protein
MAILSVSRCGFLVEQLELRYMNSQKLWGLAILNWSNRLPCVKSARSLSNAVGKLAAITLGRECHQLAHQIEVPMRSAEPLVRFVTDGVGPLGRLG